MRASGRPARGRRGCVCWRASRVGCDADRSRDSAYLVPGSSNVVLAGLVALRAPPIGKKENPLTSGGCFDNFALRKHGWTPPRVRLVEEGGVLLTLLSRGRMDTRRTGSIRLYFWGGYAPTFRGSIRVGRPARVPTGGIERRCAPWGRAGTDRAGSCFRARCRPRCPRRWSWPCFRRSRCRGSAR